MNSLVPKELVIAARLADPEARARWRTVEEIDWAMVLATLMGNKVPLLSLPGDPAVAGCPLLAMPGYLDAVFREEADWRTQRDEYALVFDRFACQGVRPIFIKSAGLAPSFPYTSDNLDVLVHPEQVGVARNTLEVVGYVELRNVEEPQKFLFRKFSGGKSVSAIHLHGLVGWGVPFMEEEALWANCRESVDDPLVLIPAPEDALLITVAHALYENKRFKLLDLIRIRHCLRQKPLDFGYMERVASRRGWADGLAFSLSICARLEERLYGETLVPRAVLKRVGVATAATPWVRSRLESTLQAHTMAFPFRVSFLFGKVLYYKKILADSERSLRDRVADVVRTLAWGIKLKLGIRGQRGMLVSLSGIDGSGKTAHVAALAAAFATADLGARHYWSRSGAAGWMAWLTRSGRSAKDPSPGGDTASFISRRRQRLRNPVLRLGWLALTVADLVVRYNLRVRLPRLLGAVVLCDRYIYDAMVEIEASLPAREGWARFAERLLSVLCPQPDLAWLLDLPARMAADRQPDEVGSTSPEGELGRQRAAFQALAVRYGLTLLDTRDGIEETTSTVVRETLRSYYRGFSTWVNALLLSNPSQMNG